MYVYGNISLNSSWNEKCFRQSLYRKSKHTFCVQELLSENCAVRNIVKKKKKCKVGQVTDDNITRHMRIACWTPKATDTHAQYVILTAFPWQHWLHERASIHIIRTVPVLFGFRTSYSNLPPREIILFLANACFIVLRVQKDTQFAVACAVSSPLCILNSLNSRIMLWMRRFTILATSITELYFATVVNAGCIGIGSKRDESVGKIGLTF
jgi:hypothetical protein